jgi:hypothetical protein
MKDPKSLPIARVCVCFVVQSRETNTAQNISIFFLSAPVISEWNLSLLSAQCLPGFAIAEISRNFTRHFRVGFDLLQLISAPTSAVYQKKARE